MHTNRRLARMALVTPMMVALSGGVRAEGDLPAPSPQSPPAVPGYPSIPAKGSPGGSLPYRSTGPASLSMIPSPQSAGAVLLPVPFPVTGQVAAPYLSTGPAIPAAGTTGPIAPAYPSTGPAIPVVSGSQQGPGPDGAYPGATGGSMAAPSPYESTAAPGTSSPYAARPGGADGVGAGGPTMPIGGFGAAAAGGPEGGAFGGGGGAASSGLGGIGGSAETAFAMIGDASPLVGFATGPPALPGGNPPKFPPPGARSLIAPSVRGFKIAENQSPVPQDRFFFSFNSYNNVNKTLDKFFQAPIKGIQIYRYVFGYEKTFNEGRGSIGIRLPLDNVFARSNVPSLTQGGNSTALGNLTIYAKHVFAINRETGSVATGGFAISPSTAAPRFGNAPFLAPSNTTSFQPFFAFLLNRDRLYFQGFSALDVPVDPAQPTLFYNDLGVGYYIYRDPTFRNLITGLAPTFEVHVNSPINHSGAYNPKDNNGTPDIVNLTSGLNTRFRESSILTLGVVVPVTGPRPFSVEGAVLLNVYFGRSRRTQAAPIIGG